MKQNSHSANSELQSEKKRGNVMFKAPSQERIQEVLNAPFDIRTHKETFIDYLEIIIKPDGTPEYAVPSHMRKLAEVYGKPWEDVYEEFMQERTGLDGIDWLCLKTGCISVWQYCIQGVPNAAQLATLKQLHDEGLYTGLPYPGSEVNISVKF